MGNYAVINNGLVINTIVAESKEIAEQCNPSLTCVELPNYGGIGWTYDGTNFSAPVIETPAEETPAE